MKIERFEDIKAWQKAGELTLLVYSLFRKSKDFRFNDQIQSASVSIMNNIAEGFERQSNKEFARFLYIARGSCGEVRSMSYLALKLKYITVSDFKNVTSKCLEISKMLYGFIKSIQK